MSCFVLKTKSCRRCPLARVAATHYGINAICGDSCLYRRGAHQESTKAKLCRTRGSYTLCKAMAKKPPDVPQCLKAWPKRLFLYLKKKAASRGPPAVEIGESELDVLFGLKLAMAVRVACERSLLDRHAMMPIL